jgi:hypothetical protein
MAINRRPRPIDLDGEHQFLIKRDELMSIRISKELKARIKARAKKDRVTMSDVCIRSMLFGTVLR